MVCAGLASSAHIIWRCIMFCERADQGARALRGVSLAKPAGRRHRSHSAQTSRTDDCRQDLRRPSWLCCCPRIAQQTNAASICGALCLDTKTPSTRMLQSDRQRPSLKQYAQTLGCAHNVDCRKREQKTPSRGTRTGVLLRRLLHRCRLQ